MALVKSQGMTSFSALCHLRHYGLAGHVHAQLGAVRWFSSGAVRLCDFRPPGHPMSSSALLCHALNLPFLFSWASLN